MSRPWVRLKGITVWEANLPARLILAPTRLTDKMANLRTRAGTVSFSLTTRPLVSACGRRVGTVLVLSEAKRLHRWLNEAMGSRARITFADLVGESREFIVARHLAMMASCSDSNILLTGETGTGKDALAQAIHNASSRSQGPFVALNCAAIPRELIASELFGYADGAFTGARRGGYMGKFLLANGGTLFLDEIGEMPLDMQAALLRVLEDKEITPVGSTETVPLDVRVIAASNKDLVQEARNGTFRSDLYYRLNVINIHLPPLRERRLDIPLLARAFVERFCRRNKRAMAQISSEAMEILSSYSWPGNVRELQNVIERALVLCQEGEIGVGHLPPHLQLRDKVTGANSAFQSPPEKLLLRSLEAEAIRACLARCSGNRALAARELGIARSTLYRKLKAMSNAPTRV